MICAFLGIAEEKPKNKKEKMFTCCHGRTLSFKTARAALGLPFELKAPLLEDTEEPSYDIYKEVAEELNGN